VLASFHNVTLSPSIQILEPEDNVIIGAELIRLVISSYGCSTYCTVGNISYFFSFLARFRKQRENTCNLESCENHRKSHFH